MMLIVFFFNQRTAYELRISDWSSDVCSADLKRAARTRGDVADIALGRFGRRLQPFDLARRGVDAEHGMFERVLRGDVQRLAVGPPGDPTHRAVPHVRVPLCRAAFEVSKPQHEPIGPLARTPPHPLDYPLSFRH